MNFLCMFSRRYLSEALDELESKVNEVQEFEKQIQLLKIQVSNLQVVIIWGDHASAFITDLAKPGGLPEKHGSESDGPGRDTTT